MKRMLTSILMAAGIAGPFVAHVGAQDSLAVANIPFTFVANQKVMSPGRYALNRADASGSTFTLRNVNGQAVIFMAGSLETGSPDRPHLTFACYGKECVLAKIAPPASAIAYSLSERALEKNLHHTLSVAAMVSIKVAAR